MTPHDKWLDAVSYEQGETEDEREQREIDQQIRDDEAAEAANWGEP